MQVLKDRLLVVAVGALAALATLIDFASRLLSIFADGVMMLGLMALVWLLYRHMGQRVAQLEEQKRALEADNARLVAQVRGVVASAARGG